MVYPETPLEIASIDRSTGHLRVTMRPPCRWQFVVV